MIPCWHGFSLQAKVYADWSRFLVRGGRPISLPISIGSRMSPPGCNAQTDVAVLALRASDAWLAPTGEKANLVYAGGVAALTA